MGSLGGHRQSTTLRGVESYLHACVRYGIKPCGGSLHAAGAAAAAAGQDHS